MASQDNLGDTSPRREHADRIDVAPGFPADRVRWGPILAGAFTALTALAILGALGAALGLSTYDRGQDDPRTFAAAGGIWGIISMIVAFGLGGWVTARSSAVRGADNGTLNGALVAAVGIPLMLFFLGSAATAMSSARMANPRDADRNSTDGAVTAGARIGNDAGSNANARGGNTGTDRAVDHNDNADRARHAGSRAAWGTLLGMLLAVGASSAAGSMGARRDHHHGSRHSHTTAGGTI